MADIKTRPATPEFRDGWDRIFSKPAKQDDQEQTRIVRVAPLIVPRRVVEPNHA